MKEKIRETGSYLYPDEHGFLPNKSSKERIQDKWLPAIESVIEAYKDILGDQLLSIYLRGSVAKGEAIDTIADLDTISFTKKHVDFDKKISRKHKKKIMEDFPFIEDVEISIISTDQLEDKKGIITILKTSGVCIYGEDILKNLPQPKIGTDTLPLFKKLKENHLPEALKELDDFPENRDKVCSWIMKRILRNAHGLVQERSRKYTRDLYRCYEDVSKFYPEKEGALKEALRLAIFPTQDAQQITNLATKLTNWIDTEARKLGYIT